MVKQNKKGFTVIELLIVVGIIGALATIILVAVSNSRSKGYDAAIVKQMLEASAQAEVFYTNNGTYQNICTATGGIGSFIQQASTIAGTGTIVTSGAAQTETTANCYSTASGYAASVKLKLPSSPTYYCIDSQNKRTQITSPLSASVTACS